MFFKLRRNNVYDMAGDVIGMNLYAARCIRFVCTQTHTHKWKKKKKYFSLSTVFFMGYTIKQKIEIDILVFIEFTSYAYYV